MQNDGADNSEHTVVFRGGIPASLPMGIAHFITYLPDGERRRIAIRAHGLTIGRQPGCDIVHDVPELSRRHCRIELDGEWAVLSDLRSTNGTFVGGVRATGPVRLRNGAQITLGPLELRYERRDEQEVEKEARLDGELRRALDYIRAILPEPITAGPVHAEWWFAPSSELGGDAFGYQFLDDTTLAGFLLDVSGHGIGSAMHAVNAANILRRRALPGVDFRQPGQVAAGLNAMFPMEDHNGLMLTLWYFVYSCTDRTLRFCAAGHHPSYLVTGQQVQPLWVKAPSIGMLPFGKWAEGSYVVPVDASLHVFSDGVFEIVTQSGTPFGLDQLRPILAQPAGPGASRAQSVYQAIRNLARPGPLDDDFSLLVLQFPE